MRENLYLHLQNILVLQSYFTLPAKGVIPDEHPLCIGGLGLIGTKPSYEAMKHADTLIMVGTSYPFTGFLPEKLRQFISIQILPKLGKRYATDIGLAGDAEKLYDG